MIRCLFLLFYCLSIAQPNENWIVEANFSDDFTPVTVANGYLGITPEQNPLQVRHIVASGLYDRVSPEGVSRLMTLPNPMNFEFSVDGKIINPTEMKNFRQRIDLKKSVYSSDFEDDDFSSGIKIMPLRQLPQSVIYQIKITAKRNLQWRITQQLRPSGETDNASAQPFSKEIIDLDFKMKLHSLLAKSNYERHGLAWAFAALDTPDFSKTDISGMMYEEKTLRKGESYTVTFLFAFASSVDYRSPLSQAERMVVYGQSVGERALIDKHLEEWERLWQSDIIIEGDEPAQQAVRLALYNLYASTRVGTGQAIPPFGLTGNGYNGHIFWDAELWMLPPLIVLQPDLAKPTLDYRIRNSGKARQIAQSFGYEGMMFPWESDDKGEESTPSQFLTGILEHHITADVGIALWNFYCATKDEVWLRQKAFPVMEGIAKFWESRVSANADGTFSVKGVVGADEYAHNVTDNAFTNGAVKRFLLDFKKADKHVGGRKFTPKMEAVSQKIRILADGKFGHTLEYEGYNGAEIKQADVNMLAFPLGIITDENRIKTDIAYYEPRLDANGPAMAHAILSVNFSRMGNLEKAYEHFLKAFVPNQRRPLGALAESADKHSQTQFVTASGGLLQAVLFGFANLEITEKGIVKRKSVLPKHWKSLTIKGVGKNKETIVIN
ncbi:MAG: glycoside hydrolase family 65 protein [Capnocytophaga sp.]|nr:glycoside hydrolase family 65 protein [Capnocytophaga sp.]